MAVTNDLIYQVLAATAGAVNDKLLVFYKANGATSNDLADAEYEFLAARVGVTATSKPDMWVQYLVAKGHTGTIRDMKNQWWAAGGVV